MRFSRLSLAVVLGLSALGVDAKSKAGSGGNIFSLSRLWISWWYNATKRYLYILADFLLIDVCNPNQLEVCNIGLACTLVGGGALTEYYAPHYCARIPHCDITGPPVASCAQTSTSIAFF
ncbi:uncharacterized protein RAG0_02363 [Rhynchosporium agropyri]|uniref:Hydrophobin n=1 Tax=Rhynchosporium agropyri TaxID=914238 RepID=A0A1E1K1D9_9HELO|nr:uncharacterized protein RAG0_02363 [Rhynchosporium agropyri]